MKVVILAGGFGTRLSEETVIKPKPMVEIGGMPILWHIMKLYSSYRINEFVVCLGYKGYVIKEFFLNYRSRTSDISIDTSTGDVTFQRGRLESWRIHLIDTGENTMTGGRLRRVGDYLEPSEPFFMTYGDGLTDVNLAEELAFHRGHKRKATVLAVQPPGRFGAFELHGGDDRLPGFKEKPDGDGAWISGGFFVLDPSVLDYIDSDSTVWEREPMEKLAEEGEMMAYRHRGFWQAMDTLRDQRYLESLWSSANAPWCTWDVGPMPFDRRKSGVR